VTESTVDTRGGREPPGYDGITLPKWVSVHLPVDAPLYTAQFDNFLRGCVFPLIRETRARQLATSTFFVRYAEGGTHVRVRLLPPQEERARIDLTLFVERWAPPACTPIAQCGRWVGYAPELSRYAGHHGIGISERLFDASTTLAMEELTPDVSSERSARLGRALLAILVTAHGLCQDVESVLRFADTYGKDHLWRIAREQGERDSLIPALTATAERRAEELQEYVAEAWERLESGTQLTPALDQYRAAIGVASTELKTLQAQNLVRTQFKVFRTWPEAIGYLLPSYVHMAANRLGISIAEEAFLAFVLHRALRPDV
jgi:thiopeptide-type bacteriocin biosynthesis protein